MTDGQELFSKILDIEYQLHPDTIKARARRTNTKYLQIEQQLKETRKQKSKEKN